MLGRSIFVAVSVFALLSTTSTMAQDRATLCITPTSDGFETYLTAAMT